MRRLGIVLAAGAALALAVVVVQRGGEPEGSASGATTAPVVDATAAPDGASTSDDVGAFPAPALGGSGPTTVVAGVPMGYSPDADGAEAAARTFVRASAAMVEGDRVSAEAAQRVMASAGAEEDLVAKRLGELASIWGSTTGGDLHYWYTPVASRAALVGEGLAEAEVWYVGYFRGDLLPGLQIWRTASYQLVWEDGDWRVAGEDDIEGPVPSLTATQATPSSAAELDALLAGFESHG